MYMKTMYKQQFKIHMCECSYILPAEAVAYTLRDGSFSYAFPWLWRCRT